MTTGRLYYASGSEKGTERNINKDSLCLIHTAFSEIKIFAVFDGVSSAKHAKLGVNFVTKFFKKSFHEYLDGKAVAIKRMLLEANKRLVNSQYNSPESTIVLGYVNVKMELFNFVSIGDTRVYAVSKQYIKKISVDDNPIGQKNIVTKYLGLDNLCEEDVHDGYIDLSKENALVCTDGFYSIMEKNVIDFHEAFMLKTPRGIESRIKRQILGKNTDDATYQYVGLEYV